MLDQLKKVVIEICNQEKRLEALKKKFVFESKEFG